MRSCFGKTLVTTVIILAGCRLTAHAELQPEEIVIVAASRSSASKELAEYYAQRRGVPKDQICLLPVEPGKNVSRAEWDERVRPFLRQWILKRGLESRVRCLLTVYDVPLKVGRIPQDALEGQVVYLQAERRSRVSRIDDVLKEVEALAGGTPESDRKELTADTELKLISRRMSDVFREARGRLAALKGKPEGKGAAEEYVQAIGRAGGLRHTIQFWSAERVDDPARELEIANQLERAKGRYQGLVEGRNVVSFMPESPERLEQLLALIEASDGLLGTVVWIDEQLALLKKNESASSFDSELSLLFWPRYPLVRWVPNLLHYRHDNSPGRHTRLTLMVARIEAPTLERCKAIIDESIAAEEDGLTGKVYIDARGMKKPEKIQPGSYAAYDVSLRQWARTWEESASLPVVLNNEPELFQAGDCPETALYCGWYSLAKYVDAFTFIPGAVAYHLASSEATTLRNADSQVWCKRLLEDGAAATLGPVFEPYLIAFPPPHEFFTLLGSGKLSLVECYYRTKPFNSWAMTLVGDPLYTPFRSKPVIKLEELPAIWRQMAAFP